MASEVRVILFITPNKSIQRLNLCSGFRPDWRRFRRSLQLSPELPGGPDDAVPQRSGVRDASLREELPGCLEIRCTDSVRGILHADR